MHDSTPAPPKAHALGGAHDGGSAKANPSSAPGARTPAASVDVVAELDRVVGQVREAFSVGRRVLSFQEYLALFASEPERLGRDASRYVRDMFDFYGQTTVQKPFGEQTRYALFDLPFADPTTRRERLVGQEEVQGELYRILSNFGREGRPNKLVLLHGPNGSSKSTVAACLMRALEHYSSQEEGKLYRFHWVFPSAKTIKSRIGFRDDDTQARFAKDASYAHLDEELIDAKLNCEIRDHPLFLVPPDARRAIIEQALAAKGVTEPPPEWLLRGRLSHKSQQVFEALLANYRGDLREVLRHVLVERYFISRRYRVGAVTIGPQMSVDAGERQITADRSLGALPASLQAVTMFEAFGELVDAHGGILEYSDLLKRPLDTYKYLQLSVETGEVALQHQNVQLNSVLVASANEVHLHALREHPEWASFRGRLELIRTPYLRSYVEEQSIYDAQIATQVRRHVAPHATFVAALFAVLTRMRRASETKFPNDRGSVGAVAASLSAIEKADLYARAIVPERLEPEQAKLLHASIALVYDESRGYPIYEGRIGASPREIKSVLLDAAQHPHYKCLSPLAVLEELEELSSRTTEYEWLQQEPLPGGYHDTKSFREVSRVRLLDLWEEELRAASGLVEERSYADLFERYVRHVSVWVKGEKIRNSITGEHEDPDTKLLQQIEKLLAVRGDANEFRRGIMSGIAAWSIDHPGQKIENERVFPQHLRKLREATFAERKRTIAEICKHLITLVVDEGKGLDATATRTAKGALERLESMGYCPHCARDLAVGLLRHRLS
jgi:predicted Ser/Thr protein kinase